MKCLSLQTQKCGKLQARKNDENEIKFLQTDFSEFACLHARCIMCIE